jgi:hypothetical protein
MAKKESYCEVLEHNQGSASSVASGLGDLMALLQLAFGAQQWKPSNNSLFVALAGKSLPTDRFGIMPGYLLEKSCR